MPSALKSYANSAKVAGPEKFTVQFGEVSESKESEKKVVAGAKSSSMMMTATEDGEPMLYPLPLVMLTLTVSVPSTRLSLIGVMFTLVVIAPAASTAATDELKSTAAPAVPL